jgi:hypothetical protein
MVKIPKLQKYKEVKINEYKQIERDLEDGWLVCGIKCVNEEKVVILEKDINC